MTITLPPRQEQAIQAAIDAGLIRSVEELIDSALERLTQVSAKDDASPAGNLFELFSPIRGLLTDEEIDRLFRRDASPGRSVDLG